MPHWTMGITYCNENIPGRYRDTYYRDVLCLKRGRCYQRPDLSTWQNKPVVPLSIMPPHLCMTLQQYWLLQPTYITTNKK